jgi:hypothetical protein
VFVTLFETRHFDFDNKVKKNIVLEEWAEKHSLTRFAGVIKIVNGVTNGVRN